MAAPEVQATMIVPTFPADASWDVLKGHCLERHENACKQLVRMSNVELIEQKSKIAVQGY